MALLSSRPSRRWLLALTGLSGLLVLGVGAGLWMLWPLPAPTVIASVPVSDGRVLSISYSRGGDLITVAESGVSIWKNHGRIRSAGFRWAMRLGDAVAASADGNLIATVDGSGDVALWDSHSGAKSRLFSSGRHLGAYEMSFSPDGKTLAATTVRDDQAVIVWHTVAI